MTTLDFKESLIENPFSYANNYIYFSEHMRGCGLYFDPKSPNYPYIFRSNMMVSTELRYSIYNYQLRGRLLNTKKIKEVLNGPKVPLWFSIKGKAYLIGKGFLAESDMRQGAGRLLFVACVDGTKHISSMSQVKFFISKEVYTEQNKVIQTAIKDLVGAHDGDIIMCNDILDYIGEKLALPKGGSLAEMNQYKDAVVEAALREAYGITGVTSVPSFQLYTSSDIQTTAQDFTTPFSAPHTEILPQ